MELMRMMKKLIQELLHKLVMHKYNNKVNLVIDLIK